jgi:hypothetical protein
MNIKSLLFGSAAALVAVSGARAADAVVVAEPEPAEYVKICDVYGAGYYYIPGTETCLKISGYVRVTVGAGGGDANGHFELAGLQDVLDKKDLANDFLGAGADVGLNDTYSWATKADISFDARSETELGTLRSYIELSVTNSASSGGLTVTDPDGDDLDVVDAGWTSTSTSPALEHAYIQLAGLTVGYSDSLFESITESGDPYAINDSVISYTPGKAHFIAYTFDAGNGFAATIGLEAGANNNYVDSYTPHVVVGGTFTQGWGSIEGVVGYDSNFGKLAGKLRVNVNVNDQFSVWAMGGLASGNDSIEDLGNHYNTWAGDWAVWAGANYKFSEKGTVYGYATYTNGNDVGYNGDFGYTTYSKDVYGGAIGVSYNLVPGFLIQPEVSYASAKSVDTGDRDSAWGVNLRFKRSF